jgi:8-oxo-dGTP pyrophosphatase MutT (NUDIX family)
MVRRGRRSRFRGGAWVFPGGAVEPEDGIGEAALCAAAARELREETGIALSQATPLIVFSHWTTPPSFAIRFDTWFYLGLAPAGANPHVDGYEVTAARWYAPSAALDAARAGEIALPAPTTRQLEQLTRFASSAALIEHASQADFCLLQPPTLGSGEMARIALPGEPDAHTA